MLYFSEVEDVMKELDVLNKKENIWNLDETSVSMDHNPPKVLTTKDMRPYAMTHGKSSNITMIAAGNAAGHTIPPAIIFKGERCSERMREGTVAGTMFKGSKNGWSNSTLFEFYMKHHFSKHVPLSQRPCLLFYDGHTTHYTCDVLDVGRDNDIHCYVLPPNQTHNLQPMDRTVFGPFKNELSQRIHKWMAEHPMQTPTQEDMPKIMCETFVSTMKDKTIKAGFRKTGLYPLDIDEVLPPPPPQPTTKKKPKAGRQERKEIRAMKLLFEQDMIPLEQAIPKKPKQVNRIIPKHGGLATKDEIYQKKKASEAKAKARTAAAEKRKNTATAPTVAPPKKKTVAPQKKTKRNLCKKGRIFQLTQQDDESDDDEMPVFTPGRRASGERNGGASGSRDVTSSMETEDASEQEDEVCWICGLAISDSELDLYEDNWGECDNCRHWVHLEACCGISIDEYKEWHMEDNVPFFCPKCISIASTSPNHTGGEEE